MPNENWSISEAIIHEVPSNLRKELNEALEGLRGVRPTIAVRFGLQGGTNPEYLIFRQAKGRQIAARMAVLKDLSVKLGMGILIATGRYRFTAAEPTPIPPSAWTHIKFYNVYKSTCQEHPTKTFIFDVRISRASEISALTTEAVRKVEATSKTEANFVHLLCRIMREYPDEPCLTKAQLLQKSVAAKWSIGPKGINRCWEKAVCETGSKAWQAEGRRKQSALAKLPDWAKQELGLD